MQNKHFKKLCLLKPSVHVWVCATLQLPAADPKKTADPLKLKLQGAVNLAVWMQGINVRSSVSVVLKH